VDFFATHRVAVNEKGEFKEDTYDPNKLSKNYQPSPLTYSHWLRLKKAEGSPIEWHLRKLNASLEYYNRLKRKPELLTHLDRLTGGKPESIKGKAKGHMPHGIIPRFGFALISIRLVDWEPHESTRKLADALLAKETESHLAEGVRQKAGGERDAFQARGSGEANRYAALMLALVDKGVNPNVAAEVIRTQIEMEQLHGAGVSTYVRGQAGVMVPTQMGPSVPPTPPAT